MQKIAVIGIGLIGGSILKGLKELNYKLIGVARRQETIDKALEERIISQGSTDISIVKDADVIFICAPINMTVSMIQEVSKIAKPEALITDVASIKGAVMNFVNANPEPINFIGGHPMAGTENKGIEASFSELFEGAKWVLTPSKWSKSEETELLQNIIKQLGAETIVADPQEHDKAVALISHMPLFLSQSLFSLVKNHSGGDLAIRLAASGFRDMTRLAATNPELTKDMLFENKAAALTAFRELLNEAADLIVELAENEENFAETSVELAEARKKMYSPEGKNIYTEQ